MMKYPNQYDKIKNSIKNLGEKLSKDPTFLKLAKDNEINTLKFLNQLLKEKHLSSIKKDFEVENSSRISLISSLQSSREAFSTRNNIFNPYPTLSDLNSSSSEIYFYAILKYTVDIEKLFEDDTRIRQYIEINFPTSSVSFKKLKSMKELIFELDGKIFHESSYGELKEDEINNNNVLFQELQTKSYEYISKIHIDF
mmetsp:Transcript_1765/g.1550  ORF Transcript_1765/g.1550 Transcript_1765/m.1550 type:complete len:197 (+) Transcript_1765:568-1158(+)